jgi:hypothetical protein
VRGKISSARSKIHSTRKPRLALGGFRKGFEQSHIGLCRGAPCGASSAKDNAQMPKDLRKAPRMQSRFSGSTSFSMNNPSRLKKNLRFLSAALALLLVLPSCTPYAPNNASFVLNAKKTVPAKKAIPNITTLTEKANAGDAVVKLQKSLAGEAVAPMVFDLQRSCSSEAAEILEIANVNLVEDVKGNARGREKYFICWSLH